MQFPDDVPGASYHEVDGFCSVFIVAGPHGIFEEAVIIVFVLQDAYAALSSARKESLSSRSPFVIIRISMSSGRWRAVKHPATPVPTMMISYLFFSDG